MKKKLAAIAFAGATLGLFAGAPSAGAAHCTDSGAPGNSEYSDHVRSASHKEGSFHKGYSSCVEASPNYTG